MYILNDRGELVDPEIGEVVSEELMFCFERYDYLVPINTRKFSNTDEERYMRYIKYMDYRRSELDDIINILYSRIEDENIRKNFIAWAEEMKKYGRPGILAAFTIAHYRQGLSIKTKALRKEFNVSELEFRKAKKLLHMRLGKKDIDAIVLEKLKQYDNFEELKRKYFELKEEEVFSGKNIETRINILLGSIKRNPVRKKNDGITVTAVDDKNHVICPKCGQVGVLKLMEFQRKYYYYVVVHYVGMYRYQKHYLGKNVKVQKVLKV
ncbi:hypothetical protein [Stygiolobus caldivivus]|uniref:Uncharacterized protein n=1 Tax=Stygiolobus caldivivus TaxID=2824673 RepID=A0A8D5U5R2_9CREN|nr:hypothetical protein [Stygiolobus caldivivus]BCU69813.1 hypothetical protein KN1_11100 [Stygiolobus caldivivus]